MNKRWAAVVAAALVAIATIAAQAQMGRDEPGGMMGGGGMMDRGMMGEGGMMGMSMRRHHYVMKNGVTPRYAAKKSPLAPTTAVVEAGGRLYQQYCAACHGPRGQGDGEAGQALSPKPANIAAFARMPMASDGYLYWTIAEGGAPVGSAMPAFGELVDEDGIWRLIAYLRQL